MTGRHKGTGLAHFAGILLLMALPITGISQRTIVFQWNGQTYRADFVWAVNHSGTEYKSRASHIIDRSKDASFDLEATFRFRNDSVPTDNDVVWGFQFRQSGGLITPTANEKFTRSYRLFQRFQVDGTGNATLTITPKAWKRNAAGQFDAIGQAAPVTIGFSVIDAPPANTAPIAAAPVPEVPALTPTDNTQPQQQQPTVQPPIEQAEARAYAKAQNESDSTLRTIALRNFIDQYGKTPGIRSFLVDKALKDVPLGTSLPENKGGGTFTYTFNNAVKPVVDTGSVQGWKWKLSDLGKGSYRLILNDIGDTIHTIRIADIGKNAPFNQLRNLSPFERIKVLFLGETSDSFTIAVAGGIPPFFVYLSQDNVPKIRYTLTSTDTTWSLSKDACETCGNGQHTLEVYNSDFSTLLLRTERAVRINHVNFFFLTMYCVIAILLVYFFYKPIQRAWHLFRYESKLRDIEAWEKKVAEEERQRRKGQQ